MMSSSSSSSLSTTQESAEIKTTSGEVNGDDDDDEVSFVLAGSCHCKLNSFEITIRPNEANYVGSKKKSGGFFKIIHCNCTVCTKKGILHVVVEPRDFRVISGCDESKESETLSTYTFGTGKAKHMFCKRCGMHSFYRARSHPDHFTVNARCLEKFDENDILLFRPKNNLGFPFPVELLPFDGRDSYEKSLHTIEAAPKKSIAAAPKKSIEAAPKKSLDTIEAAPKGGKRKEREFWNCESTFNTKRKLAHFKVSLPAQKRCIVCCSCVLNKHRVTKNPHRYRLGMKTMFGCGTCGNLVGKGPVALCMKPKFNKMTGKEYEAYRNMSCFEIHHSGMKYPPLLCENNNETE